MTLTKVELAENLIEKFHLSKREAKDLVESFFEEIRIALETGNDVKLSGFGNFELRDKSSRPGRNPKTGETLSVDPHYVAAFRSGQELKKSLWNLK